MFLITISVVHVKGSKIPNSTIETYHIADGAISGAKLSAEAIISSNLGISSVITSKIDSRAVTSDKIASGSVTTDKLVDNAITTAKILDDQITAVRILSHGAAYAPFEVLYCHSDKYETKYYRIETLKTTIRTQRMLNQRHSVPQTSNTSTRIGTLHQTD